MSREALQHEIEDNVVFAGQGSGRIAPFAQLFTFMNMALAADI